MTVELTAPDSAEQGSYVRVSVEVQNTLGFTALFSIQMFAGPNQIFSTRATMIDGASRTFSSGFTMPAEAITVHAYVEWFTTVTDKWTFYGQDSKLVSLSVAPPPPPPPTGCSISIEAPQSAEEGETVSVVATITNNSPNRELYQVAIYADDGLISIPVIGLGGGLSQALEASFIMPASSVTVLVWVDIWYDEQWQYSNSASKVVALYAPPPPEPEFDGRITRKELDYDAVRVPFPVE